MKKIISVLILVLAVLLADISISSADADFDVGERACGYLEYLTANYPDRDFDSTNGDAVLAYLQDTFDTFGSYETKTVPLSIFADDDKQSNFEAVKRSADSRGEVIVSAHYDNIYFSGGEGAYDNGTGISCLLTVAEMLADVALPFDLTFLAACAEEKGMYGSFDYVASMSQSRIDGILLNINLDVCAGGETQFVYAEDIVTPQLDYFVNIANQNGYDIRPTVAENVNYLFDFNHANLSIPYTHKLLYSDSSSFKGASIPSVFFASCALDTPYGILTEALGREDVMHTARDNYKTLTANSPNLKNQMESIVKTVYFGLTNDDFLIIMDSATVVDEFWYNELYPIVVCIVANALIALFVVLKYKRYRIQASYVDPYAKDKNRFFDGPSEDDVFEFRD